MNENEEETLDSTNETEETENPEETTEETAETEEVEETEEEVDVEALKKENETLKAQKKHWREKSQRKSEVKPEKTEKIELSQKDFIYIAKADIHEDDIDEVIEYSQFKKITVPEAHKALKLVLENNEEERKTAQATQTKGSPKGSTKTTGEDLIALAKKGKLPETDADWDKLTLARLEARRTKK